MLVQEAIRIALISLLISGSSCYFVGFNGINAYASVNHLHLHAYYLNLEPDEGKKYTFPIQNLQVANKISNNLWFIDGDEYLLPAFILQFCDFSNDLELFTQ